MLEDQSPGPSVLDDGLHYSMEQFTAVRRRQARCHHLGNEQRLTTRSERIRAGGEPPRLLNFSRIVLEINRAMVGEYRGECWDRAIGVVNRMVHMREQAHALVAR